MRLSMSQDDLFDLTGFKQKRDQIKWLDSRGWIYQTNRFGKPIVAVEYYHMRQGASHAEIPSTEPNWGALA